MAVLYAQLQALVHKQHAAWHDAAQLPLLLGLLMAMSVVAVRLRLQQVPLLPYCHQAHAQLPWVLAVVYLAVKSTALHRW